LWISRGSIDPEFAPSLLRLTAEEGCCVLRTENAVAAADCHTPALELRATTRSHGSERRDEMTTTNPTHPTRRPRSRVLVKRFAAAAGAALMVFTAAATTSIATAAPAAADQGINQAYFKSMVKAKNKPYSKHCWKHAKKYDDIWTVKCRLGKKYQDFEVTNLTGPHYDSDTGKAAPGPALRDIRITAPSKFGKTRVRVVSRYNKDKDGDGTQERHTLTESVYAVQGGDTITVRVPIAPYDPTCGGHDINVYLTDVKTGMRTDYFDGRSIGLVSIEGVDINNPPEIERIA